MIIMLKPDGALYVCINFRQVNIFIINEAYSINQIIEQLENMAGSAVFKIMDLTKGYHQLLLHPDLNPVTVFLTPDGLY